MRIHRLAIVATLAIAPLALAQCGGTGTGTSPSPSPGTSAPSPAPSPSPSGGGTPSSGSGLSVSPTSIQGQGQPQATVTLATTAPDGGALVLMSSSNPSIVKVPATVTVAPGSRSVTFLLDTATVLSATTVTLTATYGGTSMATTITVTSHPLSAAFVVRSRMRGVGACVVEENTQELDCLLDGSASQGFVDAWIWTYTAGTSTLSHTSKDAGSGPQIATKCAFLNTATGGDGPNGDRFLNMDVSLQVQDRAGTRSAIVRQPVKLYPNRQCGFSY